jgi:hypothetical protein
MRGLAGLATVLALACAWVSRGEASWSLPGAGQSAAKAQVLPAGGTPSATATGASVTVTWPQSTLATGEAVPAYVVTRYDALTGIAQTTLADCAGTIAALTCTETGVPAGTWRYRVAPKLETWLGAQGPASASVIVLL